MRGPDLAKQGIASWGFEHLGLMGALDKALEVPVVGGPSLASSYIGMFVVFVYMWFAVHDPAARGGPRAGTCVAAAGLGRSRRQAGQTFRNVVLPLALPDSPRARSSRSRSRSATTSSRA